MDISKHIAKNCVVPSLLAANKGEALKELTHLLFEKKKLPGVTTALEQIMAREITESTGIGHGIAVPHARISGLKNLVCAVGRVNGGLDFMAVDKQPVYLIFLICYPPSQQTTYLNFVATLARMFREAQHFEAVLEAEDEGAIFGLIEEFSAKLNAPEEHYAKQLKGAQNPLRMRDAHADLILLARLQLCQEMFNAAKTGKRALQQRMDNIRALVDPRLVRQYDKLIARRPPALVPVEGDTCQGCFMKLPSKFVQEVRQDVNHIHTCTNCSRFIYIV